MNDMSKLLQADAVFEFDSLTATDDGPLRKIEQFANLRQGWRYGEGIPPSAETIRMAQFILLAMLTGGFKITDAFAEVDGDISVTAYHSRAKKGYKHYIEFTIEADGQINAIREEDRKIVDEEAGLSLAAAMTLLRKWRSAIFSTFELFPWIRTGIGMWSGSEAQHSKNPATAAVPPLSGLTAPLSTQAAFVPISKSTTGSSSQNPKFGGFYHKIYYQPGVRTLIEPLDPRTIPVITV